MNTFYLRYGKRFCDLLIGILLLIGLSWFILLIVLLYLFTFQWPAIFKQTRTGLHNFPFVMYKFRTLSKGNGSLPERRFWLGDFLRATNADELPQLWNVLKGEMSLVGPRPLPIEYASLFTEKQKERHSVKPGITGYAQVYGKNSISWQQKFENDREYINKVSFFTDIKILLKTITLVLSLKRDVSLMEEEFKG